VSVQSTLIEIIGTVIVLFGLREVFRDIFHPTRSGTLSEFVGRLASLLMRRTRLRPAVGALSLVITVFCWIATLAIGFALISPQNNSSHLPTPPLIPQHTGSSVASTSPLARSTRSRPLICGRKRTGFGSSSPSRASSGFP
jgi:hypothetical protein